MEAMRGCVVWETGLMRSVGWVNSEVWNLTNQFGVAFGDPQLTSEQMRRVGYIVGKAYHKSNCVVSIMGILMIEWY